MPEVTRRASVEEALELLGHSQAKISHPEVVTPVNLGFGGEVAAGFPHGWCDSVGLVSNVSADYDFRIESREARSCVRVFRSGAHANEFGSLMQRFPGRYLSGRKLRLSCDVRTDRVAKWAGLWLRADGEPRRSASGSLLNTMLSFDNMSDRPITGTNPWTPDTLSRSCCRRAYGG